MCEFEEGVGVVGDCGRKKTFRAEAGRSWCLLKHLVLRLLGYAGGLNFEVPLDPGTAFDSGGDEAAGG